MNGDRIRVLLAWSHVALCAAAATFALLVAVAALFQEAWGAVIGLALLVAAGPVVLAAARRRNRRSYRFAALLQAAAGLLFLGDGAYGPAAIAVLMFVGSVGFAVRNDPGVPRAASAPASPPPQR